MGDEDDDGSSTLATQGGIGLVGNVAGKALGFLFVAVVTRLVSPDEYGVFVLGVSVVMFVQGFASLNIYRSIDYFVPQFLDDGDHGRAKRALQNAFLIGIASSIAGVVALVLLRNQVASLFDEPRLEFVLLLLGVLIPLQTVNRLTLTSFNSIKKIKYRVLTQKLINPIVKTLAAAGLVLGGAGVAGLVGGQLVGVAVAIVCGVAFFLYEVDWYRGATPTSVSSRSLVSYSLPLVLAGVIYSMVGQIDFFVIGYFRSSEEVGQYRVAYLLGSSLLLVLRGFTPVFKPMIAETASDPATIRNRYQLATRWITILTLPVALTLVLAPDVYFSVLFTDEYVVASAALVALVVGYIINAGSGPEGMVLEGLGFTRLTLLNSVVLVGVNTTLDIVLVPRLGMLGAGIATGTALATASLLGIAEIYLLRGVHPVSLDLLKAYAGAAVPVAFGAGVVLLVDSELVVFALLPVCLPLLYLIGLRTVGGFTEDDARVATQFDERLGYDVATRIVR
jgi:O-antigen/teichoic acid export membrane protein